MTPDSLPLGERSEFVDPHPPGPEHDIYHYSKSITAAAAIYEARGPMGYTDEEFSIAAGIGPNGHRAIRLGLEKRALVRRTNMRRAVKTGRLARVFVHAKHFSNKMIPPASAYKTAKPHHELGPLYAKIAKVEDENEELRDAIKAIAAVLVRLEAK
jgi:hypothetical protein